MIVSPCNFVLEGEDKFRKERRKKCLERMTKWTMYSIALNRIDISRHETKIQVYFFQHNVIYFNYDML